MPDPGNLVLDCALKRLAPHIGRASHVNIASQQRVIRYTNPRLMRELYGRDPSDAELLENFGFLRFQQDSPLFALHYHGHQITSWGGRAYNTGLGDGRTVLVGELRSSSLPPMWRNTFSGSGEQDAGGSQASSQQQSVSRYDVSAKGIGRTVFSTGDGRLSVSEAVKELLFGEYLFRHDLPCSRVVAIAETDERVMRGEAYQNGCIATRIQSTSLRVGSVEALRFRQMPDVLRDVLAYLVSARSHHLLSHPTGLEDPVKDYLRRFVVQSAVTAAKMDAIGFVHGMLNSDNHSMTSEPFDFGESAILPSLAEPGFVAALQLDVNGTYSFASQQEALEDNIICLVDGLKGLYDKTELVELADDFDDLVDRERQNSLARRLGIDGSNMSRVDKQTLADALTKLLKSAPHIGYSQFFVNLRKMADATPSMTALSKDELQGRLLSVVQQSLLNPMDAALAREETRGLVEDFASYYHQALAQVADDAAIQSSIQRYNAAVTLSDMEVRGLTAAVTRSKNWASVHSYLEQLRA